MGKTSKLSYSFMKHLITFGILIIGILISGFFDNFTVLRQKISFLRPQLRSFHIMSTSANSQLYARELEIATLAVKRASILSKKLSDSIALTRSSGTQIKDDKSPVTVGDYASQAIINFAIKKNFPDDEIVGEEDADSLRGDTDEAKGLRTKISEIISDVQKETEGFSDKIGTLSSLDDILCSIDQGTSLGGSKGRFWALDPIDGTKGFLRGDQFAVCLALIENGKVVLGVIGCPNLPEHIISNDNMYGTKGGLFSAIEGYGSYYSPLFTKEFLPLEKQERIKMKQNDTPETLKVLEGVEKGHSSHSDQAKIKAQLGLSPEHSAQQTINLDSQVKYCVLAKGQADVYLRLPINDTYREKIWDHAAGNILIRESDGRVGDISGAELNFGKGRFLDSKGVIASNNALFDKVIESVKAVLGN